MFHLNPKQYGYSSQTGSADKTVIMLKLTDSAEVSLLRMINSNHDLPPPTLQFDDNFERGYINIPEHNTIEKFNFDIKDIDIEEQIEVLQQIDAKNLRCIGEGKYRLQVAAKEDIYEKTKARLHTNKQTSQKHCIKELKPAGQFDTPNRIENNGNFRSMANTNYIPSAQKVSSPKFPPFIPNAKDSIGKPISVSNDPAKRKFPIQDRISHLLALKPYTKPELFHRLQKDGLLDVEKQPVNNFLKTCRVTNFTYFLPRSSWAQIQDSWPLFTPEERDQVSKLKRHHLQAETYTSSSTQKIPHSSSLADEPSSKKHRSQPPEMSNQNVDQSISRDLPVSITSSTNASSTVKHSNKRKMQTQRLSDESSGSSFFSEDSSNDEGSRSAGKEANPITITPKRKLPIQERISHLLALKPHTKPELLHRLQKDGLHDQEKKLINIFLKTCQVKDSTYFLPKSRWAQIQDSWPLYTPEERDQVSKLKSHHLQAETYTSSSTQKRPHSSTLSDEPSSKKHHSRPLEMPSQNVDQSILKDQSIARSPVASPTVKHSNNTQMQIKSLYSDGPSGSSSEESSDNDKSAGKEANPIHQTDLIQPPENRNLYEKITSQKQRDRYKKDFDDVYDEYMSHHTFCSELDEKLKTLLQIHKSMKVCTKERIFLEWKIKAVYKEIVAATYCARSARFNILHERLKLIKSLVTVWDDSQ